MKQVIQNGNVLAELNFLNLKKQRAHFQMKKGLKCLTSSWTKYKKDKQNW